MSSKNYFNKYRLKGQGWTSSNLLSV